jgi:hypothetical protein
MINVIQEKEEEKTKQSKAKQSKAKQSKAKQSKGQIMRVPAMMSEQDGEEQKPQYMPNRLASLPAV